MDFNELKNKAKDAVKGREEQVRGGIDKASDAAKKRFGHEGQVDKVTGVAKDQLGLGEEQAEELGDQATPEPQPGERPSPQPRQGDQAP